MPLDRRAPKRRLRRQSLSAQGTATDPIRIASTTAPGALGFYIAQRLDQAGELVAVGMGVDAVRAAVKACIVASGKGTMRVHALLGKQLVMLPRWCKSSAPQRLVPLELCFRLGLVDDAAYTSGNEEPLVAGRATNVGKLAGAIFKRQQAADEAVIVAKGGNAITTVVKASIVAETYLKRSLDQSQFRLAPEARLALLPGLSTAQRGDGSNFTFTRFRCVALDESLHSPGQPMSRL